MVQEVQTQGNRYQTPNLIPWVWISERKIKEHTQVTPTSTYWCWCYSNRIWGIVWWATPDIVQYGQFYMGAQRGDTEFCVLSGEIRIPLAWIYQIEWTATWWLTWIAARVYIETADGRQLDGMSLKAEAKTQKIIVNLWKYDMIRFKMTAHYWWPDGNAVTAEIQTINIQKL